jgi:hypothetical protein
MPLGGWGTPPGGRAQDELKDFVLTYHGLEESEAFVERVIKEQGPFDGLVGFSQVG